MKLFSISPSLGRTVRIGSPYRSSNKIFAKAENQALGAQYARALLDVAQSTGDLAAIKSDMDTLNAVLKECRDLNKLMVNPLILSDNKMALIKQISEKGSFNKSTINFLSLLVEKDRIACITEIIDSFDDQYCKATNTQVAVVKSAVALEEEQEFLIAKKIQELTQTKSVKIKPIIDEAVIGGFVVEYGSRKIDLSVRGAFERVKKELSTVSV